MEKFMQLNTQTASVSKKGLWAGRIISGLPALFLLVDAVMKLVKPAPVVEATVALGYSENVIVPLGIVLLVCTVLYLSPRTSVSGRDFADRLSRRSSRDSLRVVRAFSIIFPVIFGALIWLGLYLPTTAARTYSCAPGRTEIMNVALWIIQVLLALLFLFAGGTKLVLPIETLTSMGSPNQIHLPGLFIRFIGVCEVVGALGLILPGLLRRRPGLTPLAAAGLVIIMIGATVVTFVAEVSHGPATSVVGFLAAFVAYGRWRLARTAERRVSALLRTLFFERSAGEY